MTNQAKQIVKEYIPRQRMMQIATVRGDQPWICTVYFVQDDQLNLYWLSLPERRHSQEIATHNKVAVTVPLKTDKPVMGLQATGVANAVSDIEEIERVMRVYVQKYGSGKDFYDNFIAGENHHALYRFTPDTIVLFDEVHFKGDEACQEWHLT